MNTEKIALSKLEISPDNVRRLLNPQALKELKASILAHGLMQNPVVKKVGNKYQVVAGSRRVAALNELVDEKKLSKELLITCTIVEGENTLELSLVENVVREAMHPSDEYEAYAALLKDGKNTVADVSLRFGVSAKHVEQRMQLGKVAPEIMKAFRTNKLDLKCLMAFTLCPDHKKQLNVWKSLKEWERSNAYTIKQKLTEKMFSSDSGLAKFVGREAYKNAGGQMHSDLFSTTENEFFEDGALLQKLADEKINAKVEKLQKDGWGFVEVGDDNKSWEFCSKFERLQKIPKKTDMPKCGVYVYVDRAGKLTVNMLKKEGKGSDKVLAKKKPKADISEALRQDLAAYRMEIVRLAVATQPFLCLDLLAWHAITAIDRTHYGAAIAEVDFKKQIPTKSVFESKTPARLKMEEHMKAQMLTWKKLKTDAEQFSAFVKLEPDRKIEFLSTAFAMTMKAKFPAEKNSAYEAAMSLIAIEPHNFWRPTADNFFSRVSSAYLTKIGKEIFVKDWNPKLVTKKHLVTFLSDAFKDPKKAANGDKRIETALSTWLPSGMAFKHAGDAPNAKPAKKILGERMTGGDRAA